MEQEVATQVVGLGGSTDFSLIQLFLRADFVVKSCYNYFNCSFNIFLGFDFRKI